MDYYRGALSTQPLATFDAEMWRPGPAVIPVPGRNITAFTPLHPPIPPNHPPLPGSPPFSPRSRPRIIEIQHLGKVEGFDTPGAQDHAARALKYRTFSLGLPAPNPSCQLRAQRQLLPFSTPFASPPLETCHCPDLRRLPRART